jgi:hypothetical protein
MTPVEMEYGVINIKAQKATRNIEEYGILGTNGLLTPVKNKNKVSAVNGMSSSGSSHKNLLKIKSSIESNKLIQCSGEINKELKQFE